MWSPRKSPEEDQEDTVVLWEFKLSVHLRSALTNRYFGARYGDSILVSLVLGRQRQEGSVDLLATHTHPSFSGLLMLMTSQLYLLA